MAMMYPVTEQELQNIQGVGVGKAKRYGEEFCKLIKQYCKEKNIERPEELRVRTVAKKSMQKVKIIQGIDRKLPLDDIAVPRSRLRRTTFKDRRNCVQWHKNQYRLLLEGYLRRR